MEVNTGGFIPSPHCHVDLLLYSESAGAGYLDVFASRGMELTGLNCNGNPLNPLPGVGPKHADDLRRSIELAGLVDLTGATNVGAELGPIPPDVAGHGCGRRCSRYLGPLMFHAASKDAMVTPGVDIRGVLDTPFERVPADRGRTPDRHRILVQCLGNQSGVAVPRGRRRPRCPLWTQ